MDAAVVWSEPFPETTAQATPAPIRASRAKAPIILEVRLIGDSSLVYPKAEREGFEPSRELAPPTRLAGECLQPLGHLSGVWASILVPHAGADGSAVDTLAQR